MKLKNRRRDIIGFLFVGFVFLLLAEGVLRLIGQQPYHTGDYRVDAQPELPICAHSTMGFALRPGSFNVVINDSLFWQVNQNNDSFRIVSGKTAALTNVERESTTVGIFGCSYTYGWGINDEQTYPWILQSEMPGLSISNYAVPGYGNLQALMQLRRLDMDGQFPKIVILNHASFHDSRDRLTNLQQKRWLSAFEGPQGSSSEVLENARFPFVTDPTIKPLQILFKPVNKFHKIGWGQKHLALIQLLDEARIGIADKRANKTQVSRAIIDEIQDLCTKNNSLFLLTALQEDVSTLNLLQYAQSTGAHTLNFGVDLREDRFNNMPWDGHPNANAHKVYAQKVAFWIKNNVETGTY